MITKTGIHVQTHSVPLPQHLNNPGSAGPISPLQGEAWWTLG